MDVHIAVRPHSRAYRCQGARCARTGSLGAGAIDHGLLVDFGDRLIQARVLGKRVGDDEGAVDVELALKGSADSQTALLLWITNILRKS